MKKISIIIPVYNTSLYLKRCLDSVKKQSYKNIQIIVVNDGSTDESQSILQNYKKANMELDLTLLQKDNEGLSSARNYGMDFVKGEYVFFLDSDDYLLQDAIENLMEKSQYNDIIIGNFTYLYADGNEKNIDFSECKDLNGSILSDRQFYDLFYGSRYAISACNKLYDYEFIRKSNVEFQKNSEIYAEDLLFNLKQFSRLPRVAIVHKSTYVYCQNDDSITHAYKKDLALRFSNLINDYACYNENDHRAILYTLANAINTIVAQESNFKESKRELKVLKSKLNKKIVYYFKEINQYTKELPKLRKIDYILDIFLLNKSIVVLYAYQQIKRKIQENE